MTLNFLYGLERGSNLRKNAASKLGLDKKDIFIKIELREALPEIVTGWRISISIALILAIVAEIFFPSEGGLGAYIYYSSQNVNKNAELWAAIALLGSLGFLLNRIFIWIDNRYCFWRGK
jgi:NitT/TauT family transport system permease protein